MAPDIDYLLTFEVIPQSNEVFVVGSVKGLQALVNSINNVIETKDHEHLFTPSWAGSELTEQQQIQDSQLVNKVTIYYTPA